MAYLYIDLLNSRSSKGCCTAKIHYNRKSGRYSFRYRNSFKIFDSFEELRSYVNEHYTIDRRSRPNMYDMSSYANALRTSKY